MIYTKGISIILCGYNSSKLLPETLRHLALLTIPDHYPVELVIVDNASTDQTSETAKLLWQKFEAPYPMHLHREEKQGLIFARKKGLQASKYDLILFVDDDNWLDESYLIEMTGLFEKFPNAAVMGGFNEAVFETREPFWFSQFQISYAVGPHARDFGEPDEIGLFGAGMCLRRAAYDDLTSKGFKSRLVGRSGETLSSGEDYELCKALKIAGWDILYAPQLRLKHFITKPRLNWDYLRKLNRGISHSMVWFLAYEYWIARSRKPAKGLLFLKYSWIYLVIKKAAKANLLRLKLAINPGMRQEGSPAIIALERTQITVQDLIKHRLQFTALKKEIGNARWNLKNRN
jgi:glycosyltransferase involved in cell wall biosynthesis